MTQSSWERVKEVFEAALEQAPPDRLEFVNRTCGGDEAIRAQVLLLIEQNENGGPFRENGPAPIGDATSDASNPDHSVAGDSMADDSMPETSLPDTRTDVHAFAIGETVAERFRIVRFIGRGGMGEVYEAEDLELRGRVALKTVRSEIASNPQVMARFKQEIQLARKVTHPNVCRVFDVFHATRAGGAERVSFLTMELLNGKSLFERLRSEGRLKAETALPIARQLCAGLDAAHAAGIVHRDFKTANVMLVSRADGTCRAVITDFGLAHSLENDDPEHRLTRSGAVVGTVAYMSPEQMEGRAVTPATDVYSLGVVLYEMVARKRPFAGKSPLEIAARRFRKGPDPLHRYAPELDQRWQAAILRCLEYEPERRFQSAGDVALALSEPPRWHFGVRARIAVLAALGFIALCVFAWYWMRPPPPAPPQQHIAVLTFRNLGATDVDEAFCEGLSESLTSKLSQMQQFQKALWVVPASEARTLQTPAEAAHRLGANLVIAGTVQEMRGAIRVTTDLVDADTPRVIASRTVEAPANDLLWLQDDIWERVADMLQLEIQPQARNLLMSDGTRVPGAFEFYEQGLGYLRRNSLENDDRAIDLFNKAAALDPLYSLAYAGLGDAYSSEYEITKDPKYIDLVRENAEKALRLNDKLSPVHRTEGVMFYRTGHYDEAIRELRRCLEIDPSNIDGYYWLGRAYDDSGQPAKAENSFKEVVNLRPGYWVGYSGLGYFYYHRGQYEKAVAPYRAMIQLAPDMSLGYGNLGGVYIQLGRCADAIPVLRKSIDIKPAPQTLSNLATCYEQQGHYAEAIPLLEKAAALLPKDHRYWRNLGDAYSVLGRASDAYKAYSKAFDLAIAQAAADPNEASLLIRVALYAAKTGRKSQALEYAGKALTARSADGDTDFNAAIVYELLGQRSRALNALDHALAKHYSIKQIETTPELAALRKDPKYTALNRKSNTAP